MGEANINTDLCLGTDADTDLDGVQVAYGQPREGFEREGVYGGKITIAQDISAGRSAGNSTREEHATIQFHVRVYQPGDTLAEVEARALVLGAVLEDYLAATLPAVTGLVELRVNSCELESGMDEEGSEAIATYTVTTTSVLT